MVITKEPRAPLVASSLRRSRAEYEETGDVGINRSGAGGGVESRSGHVAGAAAGVLGGLVFGMLMGMMGMLPMVASLVGGTSAGVGMVVHLAISAAIGGSFGLLFGGMATTVPTGALRGLGYGMAWWVLGPLVIMPTLMGMGLQFGEALSGPMMMSLMGHAIYGVVTGAAFPLLRARM